MTTSAVIGPFSVGETWEIDVYCREKDRTPMNMVSGRVLVQFFTDETEAHAVLIAFDSATAGGWAWRARDKGFGRLQVDPELTATLVDLLDHDIARIIYKVTAFPADGRISVQAKGKVEVNR